MEFQLLLLWFIVLISEPHDYMPNDIMNDLHRVELADGLFFNLELATFCSHGWQLTNTDGSNCHYALHNWICFLTVACDF